MEILGRYRLIRPLDVSTGEFGPLRVLDRHYMRMRPYLGTSEARAAAAPGQALRESLARWQRFKSKIRAGQTHAERQRRADRLLEKHADAAQLAAIFGRDDYYTRVMLRDVAIGSATNVSLNNNYVAGTGGNAIGARLNTLLSKTINNVYFFISSYTGTASLVTDLNLELRPEASAGATTPNTGSLTESHTVNPSSATGWINSSGWTSVLSAVTRYFFLVGDANGGATNFASVTRSVSSFMDYGTGSATGHNHLSRFLAVSTTAGWTSGNAVAPVPCMVLVFSDGSCFGNPFTGTSANASNTQQRGLIITASGLDDTLKIYGLEWTSANANLSGINIFTGSTAPNGTADHTSTDIAYDDSGARMGCFTSGGVLYTMSPGTQYRLVATLSANSAAGPQKNVIGTGADANLRAAMPGRSNWYWTQDNGSTAWSNDDTNSLPAITLLTDGEQAAAGGGGAYILGC